MCSVVARRVHTLRSNTHRRTARAVQVRPRPLPCSLQAVGSGALVHVSCVLRALGAVHRVPDCPWGAHTSDVRRAHTSLVTRTRLYRASRAAPQNHSGLCTHARARSLHTHTHTNTSSSLNTHTHTRPRAPQREAEGTHSMRAVPWMAPPSSSHILPHPPTSSRARTNSAPRRP